MSRAKLDKQPHDIAEMFDGVARRYDLTNTVLSVAQDRRWRRRTRQCLELHAGQRVLDLAAGTGVSTAELARDGALAVACDFSLGMLRAGRANKNRRKVVPFVAGDAHAACRSATACSTPQRSASGCATSPTFRARCGRWPGWSVRADGSWSASSAGPTWRPFRSIYLNYLMRALPWIARRVSSNPDAYVYLAESIRAWPGAGGLGRDASRQSGWDGRALPQSDRWHRGTAPGTASRCCARLGGASTSGSSLA